VVQPAAMVVLASFQMNNVRMLLLSGIGEPYDPASGKGTVGKNYAYQMVSSTTAYFDESVHINPFIGAGAAAQMAIDDYNADHFDHAGKGFVGGALIFAGATGGRPIAQMQLPPDAPRWGSGWKSAVRKHYAHTSSVATMGSVMSYRDRYLDLDPTYRDAHGVPLLRMTFDWHPNEYKMTAYTSARAAEIVEAMKPQRTSARVLKPDDSYDTRIYQSTHNTGGAIMGTNRSNSVVNRYSQCWDVPNVFVFGASSFPQNIGYNPTGLVGALTYFAAAKIRSTYLTSGGALVRA